MDMKRRATFLLAAMLPWPDPVHAQDRCAPLPLLEYSLARLDEELIAVGTVGGQIVRFYVDPIERGWTVLAVRPDGMACPLVSGSSFDFVKPAPPGDPS